MIISGFMTELFRIWGSGDTKLFIAASLLSALVLQSANPYYAMVFLFVNIMLYLVIGHIYTLPNSPDVHFQFVASIRKAERVDACTYTVPKIAENVLWAWISSVGNVVVTK